MSEHFRLTDWETDTGFWGPLINNSVQREHNYFNILREFLFLDVIQTNHRYIQIGSKEEQQIKEHISDTYFYI